jgi:hypothetical protein
MIENGSSPSITLGKNTTSGVKSFAKTSRLPQISNALITSHL